MKMAKILLSTSMVVALTFSALNAADYSKKSNDELLKLNGTVKNISDAADLRIEIKKRIDKLEDSAKKDFFKKLRENYEKNTENMTVKDFREYEKSVKKEFIEKAEKLGLIKEGDKKHMEKCGMHGPKDKDSKGEKSKTKDAK